MSRILDMSTIKLSSHDTVLYVGARSAGRWMTMCSRFLDRTMEVKEQLMSKDRAKGSCYIYEWRDDTILYALRDAEPPLLYCTVVRPG